MRLGAVAVGIALLGAACVAVPTTTALSAPSATAPAAGGDRGTAGAPAVPAPRSGDGAAGAPPAPTSSLAPSTTATSVAACAVEGGIPWADGPRAGTVLLEEGDDLTPRVEAVVYPHPEYAGNPWSQWGRGIVLDDGRFLSAIGDHRGADGNAFGYVFDPVSGTLRQIFDVLSLVDHRPGEWGYGKIHAPMVRGPCGVILTTTYWGTRRGLTYGGSYRGDLLLAVDPRFGTVASRGVLVPEHGVPSLAATPDGTLLYAEAADPFAKDDGRFVVTAPSSGAVVFADDDPDHTGYRAIAVAATGRAYWSLGGGRLAVYDPATGLRTELADRMPGEFLRAATAPDARGVLYGVTRDPDIFFALDPGGDIRVLGPAAGYTTSLALDVAAGRVYSVPVAHGEAWRRGAPLVALDTATGDQETIVLLEPAVEAKLGMRLGGSYDVVFDPATRRIFVGMNAAPLATEGGFGEVVLLVVTLP